METMERTRYCGDFSEKDVGSQAVAMGWVAAKRDMGGVLFVDLRDREGVLQVVFEAGSLPPAGFALAEGLKNEAVIAVRGAVRTRDEATYNPKLKTGTVELRAAHIELLGEAAPLPFPIEDDLPVREEVRLKYRYLDLRRPQMIGNLRFRHRVAAAVRRYLDADGFIEVETPMLQKSTPEGARDYLVPSRIHRGQFYALPQSPQILKQLLMVGGVDKYYQLARCFRDEDLRADRQPEFTQVDMELSFQSQEEILRHLERLFCHLFRETLGAALPTPFPCLTWRQAMDVYGSDKPDLRFGLPIVELTGLVAECPFAVFRAAVEAGGVVRAINAKGCAGFSRGAIEALTAKAQGYGAKGMAYIAIREDGEIASILTKYFPPDQLRRLLQRVDGRPGDFILFCADALPVVRRTLGGLRLDLAQQLGLRREGDFKILFVTDFPQFEYSQEEGRFVAMHHPFTMPHPADLPYLKADPGRVRAQAYDVVLNGVELGSGSIRIHRWDIQRQMFEALGFSPREIEERFGFLVRAFQYGAPPHGGFAFGLDRLVMLMLGAPSLREVIAFPKQKDASCAMSGAPGTVDEGQLAVLGLAAGEVRATGAAGQRMDGARIDVDHAAALSRLKLTEAEKGQLRGQLQEILRFAGQLRALDTAGVPPTAHVAEVYNVLRPDRAHEPFPRGRLLAAAPAAENGYIVAP